MNKLYVVGIPDGVLGFRHKKDAEVFVKELLNTTDIDPYCIFIYETEVIKTYRIGDTYTGYSVKEHEDCDKEGEGERK